MNELKNLIIENEQRLLQIFEKEYGLAIKYFIKKIESLQNDGDIIKFLNNKSILSIKKKQYDFVHSMGYKTAIDVMLEHSKDDYKCTQMEDLEEDQLVTTMTISALANNFNTQKGMYYNHEQNMIILKCQIVNGEYGNYWIKRERELLYYLEREREEYCYINCEFSNLPNKICRDIINKTSNAKVFLFYRYSRGDRYFYAGEYNIQSFAENNKAIVLKKSK